LKNANITLQKLYKSDSFHQLSLSATQEITTHDETKNLENLDKYESILSNFEEIDINNITPVQALTYLQEFKEQVKKTK
jgi:hypothetical protein